MIKIYIITILIVIAIIVLAEKLYPGSIGTELHKCERCGEDYFDIEGNGVCGYCGMINGEEEI